MTIIIPDKNHGKNAEKNLDFPDEIRTFDKGKVEIAEIDDTSIGRTYFEPGWSWEKCIKPIASSQAPHTHR